MAKELFKCSGCGEGVAKYRSQLTRLDVVFCSLSCRNKNFKKALPDWHPPNYKEYSHICSVCSTTFTANGSQNNAKTRVVCGARCRGRMARKGKKLTDETKAKLSVAATKQNKNYISNIKYISINGETLFMKSSWEKLYAAWMDTKGIKWQYEPEFILSNGKVYLPDFLLSDGTVVEIKGYFRPDAKVKWDMFCEEYPDVNKHLLQKQELKNLGLI